MESKKITCRIRKIDVPNTKEEIVRQRYIKILIEDLINEGILECFDGHGSPRGYLKGQGTYPYIRVKDIVNLEVYTNPQDLIPEFEYDRLFRSEKELKAKDIVFVRRGSYRIGDVGILYEKDTKSIFTRELLILRVVNSENKYNITPYNLLFLMNSDEVRSQLGNKIMLDTTLPNIADRWKKLYIPIFSEEKMLNIHERMKKNYENRDKFWKDLKGLEKDFKEM